MADLVWNVSFTNARIFLDFDITALDATEPFQIIIAARDTSTPVYYYGEIYQDPAHIPGVDIAWYDACRSSSARGGTRRARR